MTDHKRQIPQEPGVYWARSSPSIRHYDLVALVQGKSPFLYTNLVLPLGASRPGVIDERCWGPKIDRLDLPLEEQVEAQAELARERGL